MKFEFKASEPFPDVSPADWQRWSWQMSHTLTTATELSKYLTLSESEQQALNSNTALPVRVTPYSLSLFRQNPNSDPLRLIAIPRASELSQLGQQMSDPLGEKHHQVSERLIHRYPDRVLFLLTDQCSLYCRFCLRKHFTGHDQAFIGSQHYEAALKYLQQAPGVREVILSGGDPLTLGDQRLERVLFDLRQIEHLEIIRVATRMPVTCPMRITQDLTQILRRFKPVYVMTHFNHPRELSADAAEALGRLVDSGVPVFNQMVLLNGVNNSAALVQALSRRLLYLRVKPYYLFQCDPSEGSEHFRTSLTQSKEIQQELWGRLSGLAMPNLSLDIPGGGGKVGITPDFVTRTTADAIHFCGFDQRTGVYTEPASVAPMSISPWDQQYVDEWQQIKDQRYGSFRESP